MPRPGEDCFEQITQVLESLGAVRLTLTDGPGEYRLAAWALQGSKHRLTVMRQGDGAVTVQSGNTAPMRGETFLKKTMIAIKRQLAARPLD